MPAARYLSIVLVTFCGLLVLAVLNAWAQVGAPTKHGWYTCSYIGAKIAAGAAIPSPKLVIVSGSNALTGIDARTMARTLPARVFNFGLAASFGPGFQSFEAEKILKPGDAVLTPFEYMAYDYDTPRDSLIDAVYSCGLDYWRALDWRQMIFFVMAEKPFRMFDSLAFRSRARTMKDIERQAVQDAGALGQGADTAAPMRVATAEPNLLNCVPVAIRFNPESAGARAIAQFVGWARTHRVTVFATWPNILYHAQYDNCAAFTQIRDFYRRLGVEVIGAPKDSMFAPGLMADSVYHLNRQGMAKRTARLVQALRRNSAFAAWQRTAASARISAK